MVALLILAVAAAGTLAGWTLRGEVAIRDRISERFNRI